MLGEDFIMDAYGQQLSDLAEKELNSKEWKEKQKQNDILECKEQILKLKTILLYLEDNKWAVEIETKGAKVGICMNRNLIPVIEAEIKECEKFLRGEENEWE